MSLNENSATGLLLRPGLGPPEAAARLHATCFPDEPSPAADLAMLTRRPGALAWHLAVGPVAGKQALYALLLARAAGDEAEVLTLAVERAYDEGSGYTSNRSPYSGLVSMQMQRLGIILGIGTKKWLCGDSI